jgi:hypothetical protein
VFTARYALSPYIKQIRFVFKGLKEQSATAYRPTLLLHDFQISSNYLKEIITEKAGDTECMTSVHKHSSINANRKRLVKLYGTQNLTPYKDGG